MYVLALPVNNSQFQETYFYRKKDGKPQIFTFANQKEANTCLQLFQQFAVEEAVKQTGDPFAFANILQFVSAWELKEVPVGITCELVSFREIMKEKGINI